MDISHGCFTGSETQFDNLRCLWSQAAGYGLYDFRNQGGPVMPRVNPMLYSHQDILGEWPQGAPEDPLLIILLHDETHGRIKWEHASYLADRLQELEHKMSAPGTTPAWVLLTQQFIRGLRTASSYRQDVVFSGAEVERG